MAAARLVAFFRLDPWTRMRRVLLIGPASLSVGGVVVALSFLTRLSRALRDDAAVAGLLLIAGGAAYTLLGMHRILRDDVYLALRTDGLMVRAAALSETLIAWDELAAARWDENRRELVLERASAAPIVFARPFARITGPALAECIATTKRRIAMNLLR
jgi:hypothetical protein